MRHGRMRTKEMEEKEEEQEEEEEQEGSRMILNHFLARYHRINVL